MADFTDILNHSTTGLLPYLDTQLTGDYSRFLIRPYAFGSASLQSGFRLRDRSVTYSGEQSEVRQGVLIGKMLVIQPNQPIVSQTAAVQLARDIDRIVWHWSACICPGLLNQIENFTGTIAIEALRGVSSDQPNALWSVVIRSFEIQYLES